MRRDRPLHVTLRLLDGLPRLRRARAFDRLRSAIGSGHKDDFRVAHYAVLDNHIHLVVEADDRRALRRGGPHAARTLGDPFSSARQLDGWNQPVRLEPGVVATPRTWLLRAGWRRHGLLDAHAIPAAAPP